MRLFNGSQKENNSTSGQTGLFILLFLVIVALAGFDWHLFSLQGATADKLATGLKDQDRATDSLKNSLQDLTDQVHSQKYSLSNQNGRLESQEKAIAAIKGSVDELKKELETEIKTVKKEDQQHRDETLSALSKVENTMNGFSDEIQKLREGLKSLPVPSVEVKLDPVVPPSGKNPPAKKSAN